MNKAADSITTYDLAITRTSASSLDRTLAELRGHGLAREISSAHQLYRELKSATEFQGTVRSAADMISGVSATARLFEDMRAAHEIMTGARSFAATSAKQIAEMREAMRSIAGSETFQESVRLMRDLNGPSAQATALRSYLAEINAQRFVLPEMSSLLALGRDAHATIASLRLNARGLAEAMASMRTPWLDSANQLGSAQAFARLQDIGAGLRTLQPFTREFSGSLRDLLGDWRDLPAIMPDMLDYEVRARAYEERGFDNHLIDFPDDAFDEVLIISGISHRIVEVDESTCADEAGALGATNDLHLRLMQLEQALRRRIRAALHALHGDRWHIVGLPGGMYDQWLVKQKNDRSGRTLDAIDYCDFTDYERIIVMKPNWPAFRSAFERKESVQESFYRLQPARLATMHGRPLGRADVLFAMVEIQRLMGGLGR